MSRRVSCTKRRVSVWSTLTLAAITVVGLPVSGEAHHSFAMFDKSRVVTVKGVVRKIEWTNPHVYIFVAATDAKGAVQQYTLECGSINLLVRKGWKVNTLKVGDSVAVGIFPLRDGQPGGLVDSVTLPNGTVVKG